MSRKLFVDKVLFRITGPVISGLVIYLLILLLYNNIEHVLESFLSEELLLCIGLAIIISESSRFILKFYPSLKNRFTTTWSIIILSIITISICILLIVAGLFLYYDYSLGYKPNLSELQIFLILYISYAIVLISLFLSNHFIKQAYLKNLKTEQKLSLQSKESFTRFTRGINPHLLFESLETIVTYASKDKEVADEIIDELSLVYRYTLTKNQIEIIEIQEEIEALKAFVNLIDHLPYRSVKIQNKIINECYVIPGTLLHIVEHIIKSTISGIDESLFIDIICTNNNIKLKYIPHDKLTETFNQDTVKELYQSYQIYTDEIIRIEDHEQFRIITIPQLNYQK